MRLDWRVTLSSGHTRGNKNNNRNEESYTRDTWGLNSRRRIRNFTQPDVPWYRLPEDGCKFSLTVELGLCRRLVFYCPPGNSLHGVGTLTLARFSMLTTSIFYYSSISYIPFTL